MAAENMGSASAASRIEQLRGQYYPEWWTNQTLATGTVAQGDDLRPYFGVEVNDGVSLLEAAVSRPDGADVEFITTSSVKHDALDLLESLRAEPVELKVRQPVQDERSFREQLIGAHATIIGIGGMAIGASGAVEAVRGQPSVGLMILGGGGVLLATLRTWVKHGNASRRELKSADTN